MVLRQRHILYPRSYLPHGFTLTEIAIVLGIIGVVLGAIWSVSSLVQNNLRINKAMSELTTLAANIRMSQTSPPYFSSATQTDITCSLVNAGLFPQDMVNGTCTTGTYSTYPVNPWGSPTVVYSSTSAPDGPTQGTTQFEMQFCSVPVSASLSLIVKLAGLAQGAGITYLYDGDGVGWLAAPTITLATLPTPTISPACYTSITGVNFSSDWKLVN